MFKKAFQVAVSFALLCGGYLGYAQVFAVLVARSQAKLTLDAQAKRPPKVENASLREATQLASKHFGPDHWSASATLPYRFYHHEKGYWFYAEKLVRSDDGKTLTLTPFVSIWREKDGKAVKTISSKEAIIRMDQPIGLGKGPGGGESRIVNVQINHDVQIRDDKGTVTPTDDLKIAMNSVEYDEAALEIRTDSEVVVQDRDFWMTGTGLRMQMFPKPGGAAGFQGVRTATFKHDVHIIIKDVGRSGVLPGKATAEATGRTPVDLTNDGSMVIHFPRSAAKVIVGPPEAARPTIAEFATNVRVLRGATNPDQLNSDFLRLILLPVDTEKAAAERKTDQAEALAAGSKAPAPSPVAFVAKADGTSPGEGSVEASGPLTELGLKEAMATGHAVWLRSPSQGVTGRGNQLIYKKLSPELPDETYFRGDAGRGMEIDKVDLAEVDPKAPAGTPRAVKMVTKIRAVDATNYDAGVQGGSVVIARGPGTLESRPAATLPVERSAAWRDQLIMETTGVGPAQRRKITLTDKPWLSMAPKPGARPTAAAPGIADALASPVSAEGPTVLRADKMIVAYLSPKLPAVAPGAVANAPRDAALVRTAAGARPPAENVESGTVKVTAPTAGADSMKVDKLLALENVHLQAPDKTMRARDQLDVEFEQGVIQEKPAPAKPAAPVIAAPAPAEPSALAELPPPMNAGPDAAPPVDVSANRIWAKIVQAPGQGNEGGDVREVRLRGTVVYHQGAAPTKERGTDVTGEALDLNRDEAGLAKLVVFHRDPSRAAPKVGRPLAPGAGAAAKAPERMARVVMPEMQVEGPVIGLDQAADHSWVRGPGLLTMMADRAAAGSDNGLAGGTKDKGKDVAAKATASTRPSAVNELDLPLLNRRPTADPETPDRVPMTITWVDRMDFYGQPAGADGQPGPGEIKFVGGVRAASDEGLINSNTLDATLDGPIAFNRAATGTATPGAAKPQIARVHLRGKALVVNARRNPVTGEVDEKQRIQGEEVIYDRLAGYFNVPGAGNVGLYSRDDTQASGSGSGANGLGGMADVGGMASRTKPTITNASNSNAAGAATTKGAAGAAKAKKPLNLTQIAFQNGMNGKFGSGPASDPRSGARQAEFFKDVDVMHAEVPDVDVVLNPDRPPRKFVTLTSQSLRVISEPSRTTGGPARNLLDAWDEAYARTENSTIQADRIRFDSATGLFNAYAFSGRDVVMSQQTIVGQPPTQAVGRGIIFNRNTGERELIEPQTVQLLNQKQGARPVPLPPPSYKPAPKDKRKGFAPPQQNNKERRGFSGGRF